MTELLLPGNPLQAARTLYGNLREAGSGNADAILYRYKSPWNAEPSWDAIYDRLTKASSLRIAKNLQNQIIVYSKPSVGV